VAFGEKRIPIKQQLCENSGKEKRRRQKKENNVTSKNKIQLPYN